MRLLRFVLSLVLLACLCAGAQAASAAGGAPLTLETVNVTVQPDQPFTLTARFWELSTTAPLVGEEATLQVLAPGGDGYGTIGSAVTDAEGRVTFQLVLSTPGVYRYRVLIMQEVWRDDWVVTVLDAGQAPGATYARAREYYIAAASAWSQAWGASDPALIRQYLNQARAAYANCLDAAGQANDPANAANLALVKTVSTAYIGLADAALAMYDGADRYGEGRSEMNAGRYAAASSLFNASAERFASSQALFSQATTTLQSVSYAGTEYGDGTAYTAVIVPLLNAKASYMGEFATYARGWEHTANAYQASRNFNPARFRSEAGAAMALFDGLRSSASFGADAAANYAVLAGLLANLPPTPAPTQEPAGRPANGAWILQGQLTGDSSLAIENLNPYDAVVTLRRAADPPEAGAKVFSVYVRANEQYRVDGIPGGASYTLWFRLGEDWNPASASFAVDRGAKRFVDLLEYPAGSPGVYTVRIYGAADGTRPTVQVPPALV